MLPIKLLKNNNAVSAFFSFILTLMIVFMANGIQGQDFIRIKNRWKKDGQTDYRLNIQNQNVDAGAADPNWWSAQWVLEKVSGTDFYYIKNRWQKDGKTNYYLHNQNGVIEAGAIQPAWWSAMWSLEKVDATFYRIKNRWKPEIGRAHV